MPAAISSPVPNAATPQIGQGISRALKQSLEQEDFLKMLTMQLQNQDPLNPQTNTDFAAQMAQFTALEQSREMSTNMGQMRQQQEVQNATLLLGTAVLLDTGATGIVDRVTLKKDGSPRLLVGGKEYALAQVVDYRLPPTPPTIQSPSPTP